MEPGGCGAIVRRLTPYFPPQPPDAVRSRARYSDTNYRLFIGILEAVTGLSYAAALQELLFRPLGIQQTWVAGHAPPAPTGIPAPLWFQRRPLNIPLALRSAGDLYSTLDDTIGFMRALVRGRVFCSPASLGAMQESWTRFGFPLSAAAMRAPGWPIEYGLGIMRYQVPRVFTPARRIPAVVGRHTGSTGCWLFYCPDLDLLLSGAVNQMTAGPVPFRVVPAMLRAAAAAHPQ